MFIRFSNFGFRITRKLNLIIRKLTTENKSAMDFTSVLKKFEEFAPLSLAESWDNVGLLVEPPDMRPISKLLLTNDLTLDVMDEAVEKQVDMILSYHPPIFRPLKSITTKSWKERIIGKCLAQGIAVFSPHTSYDSLQGGINDWLLRAFGNGIVEPVTPSYETRHGFNRKIEFSLKNDPTSTENIKDLLEKQFGNKILVTPNHMANLVTVYSSVNALPDITSFVVSQTTEALFTVSDVKKVRNDALLTGSGRKMTLSSPITLRDAVKRAQNHLRLSHVRLGVKYKGTQDDLISSVAVCAGSGVSVLRGVKADLILTGEMSHHEVLDMTQTGVNVILTDHSNSERGFLSAVLQDKLTSILESKVEVVVSQKDADPLQIV